MRAAFPFPGETVAVVTSACSGQMFFSGLGNHFRRPFGYDVILPNGKGPPPCRRLETYMRNVELIIMLETSPAGMGIFVSGTTRMAAFLEPVLLG